MPGYLSAALALAFLAGQHSPDGAAPPLPDAVRVGLQVTIVDVAGAVHEGRIAHVGDGRVRLSRRGAPHDVAVERIARIEKSDRLRNGALTGMSIGVILGLVGASSEPPGRGRAEWMAAAVIGNAIGWTALGTAFDAMIDGRRTLYQRGERRIVAVSPVVGSGGAGIAMRVGW